MSALASSSAEDRLESFLKPYRDRSNAHIQAIWEEFVAEHPAGTFPSSRTMRDNSRLFKAGKRYRYALALAGYQLLTGEPPSHGLERAATWLEWYHLYTLFLDDIMDEDVRRRTLASAWATNAKLYRGAGADRPAVVFRTQRHRYGVSQAILDALRIRSLAERAIEGATDLHAGVLPRARTRAPHDEERHSRRAESAPRQRPSDDGGAHRRSSRRSAASPRSTSEERPRSSPASRSPPRCTTDSRALVLEPMGGDPEVGPRAFLSVAMLDEDRGTGAHPGPLEPHDRLRVVTEHVAAERHVRTRLDVRVHLRRDDDGDAADPRRAQQLRNLSCQTVPFVPAGLVPHREPVVHRDAVDHDQSHLGIPVRQFDGLLDPLLLFLETVRFREQDVLRHDIEIVATHLLEAVEGHALRVDVDHLVTRADDVPGELQAEVRLAAPRLPVQERDATFLDSPAQEVVQSPTAQGYLHCLDKVAAPFKASKSPPEGATSRPRRGSTRRPRVRSVPSAGVARAASPRTPDGPRRSGRTPSVRSSPRSAPRRRASRSARLSA